MATPPTTPDRPVPAILQVRAAMIARNQQLERIANANFWRGYFYAIPMGMLIGCAVLALILKVLHKFQVCL